MDPIEVDFLITRNNKWCDATVKLCRGSPSSRNFHPRVVGAGAVFGVGAKERIARGSGGTNNRITRGSSRLRSPSSSSNDDDPDDHPYVLSSLSSRRARCPPRTSNGWRGWHRLWRFKRLFRGGASGELGAWPKGNERAWVGVWVCAFLFLSLLAHI